MMSLNRINETKSTSFNGYELKSDTLDQLYREQLSELKYLIFKKAQTADIEICHKWLKVFSRISEAEKMARNCLCTLMKEQIKENGTLQNPFKDLQNCSRNLESILCELDNNVSADLSQQSFNTRNADTFKSHDFKAEYIFEQPEQFNTILPDNQNFIIKSESTLLLHELQYLRMQLTEKQIENIKLKEMAEKFRMERENFADIIDKMKKSILENIKEMLLNMEQCSTIQKSLKVFQNIFAHFSNDKEFMDRLRKYDEDLQYVFCKQFKCDFNKRKSLMARHIRYKFFKIKTKLREKFEHRLSLQNQSYKLQLQLAKHNSFSILRQIFIKYYEEFGQFNGWEILKLLEEKYQHILNK